MYIVFSVWPKPRYTWEEKRITSVLWSIILTAISQLYQYSISIIGGPGHYGWCHPWAGGPELCKKGSWASQGKQISKQYILQGLCSIPASWIPPWILVLNSLCAWLWPGRYKVKQILSSPSLFWSEFNHRTRNLRAEMTHVLSFIRNCKTLFERMHWHWFRFLTYRPVDHLSFDASRDLELTAPSAAWNSFIKIQPLNYPPKKTFSFQNIILKSFRNCKLGNRLRAKPWGTENYLSQKSLRAMTKVTSKWTLGL